VLGAQGNVWTEYMKTPRKVEYMIFPRLSALSEVLWSPKETRNWSDFEKKLQTQFKRYDFWKANYSKAYFDLKATILPSQNNTSLLWKLETKQASSEIKYVIHKAGMAEEMTFAQGKTYTSPVEIKNTQIVAAISMVNGKAVSNPVTQTFLFNKATGKKITLAKEPSKNYPGDGAFTLVNGIQNDKGRARSKEFLGFNGEDCEAVIDLGSEQNFSTVTIHTFHQKGAWIWRPQTMEVFLSGDGKNFSSIGLTDDFYETKTGNGTMKVEFATIAPVRYVKVVVRNWSAIPTGEPGAGNKPWLFLDEIEIN
jgi:hexosaminidase